MRRLIVLLLLTSCGEYYQGDLSWNYLPTDKFLCCEYIYDSGTVSWTTRVAIEKRKDGENYCLNKLKGEIIAYGKFDVTVCRYIDN